MDFDKYAFHLGSLLANFQSLEFCLRAYLQGLPKAAPLGTPCGVDIHSVPLGSTLPENAATNYDTLGQLIGKYNKDARSNGWAELDRSLVTLRDALAHGRVSATKPSDQLHLLKFSKPVAGTVTVTFNELLTDTWFIEQKRRVRDALLAVASRLTPPANPGS